MRRFLVPLLAISILVNVALLLFLFTSSPLSPTSQHKVYPFLSKRIFAENQNDMLINFGQLRAQLRSYVSSLHEPTGVYFEYLPSGISIGVNEKQEFIPASLIKVPIVMAVYKKIEMGKLHKNDFIPLEDRFKDKTSGSMWKMPAGSQIAVKDAIDKTLDESDNTAKNVLLSLLTRKELTFVFDSLDLGTNVQNDASSMVTPKNYSSIFRSLYLSSYLTQEHSNEVLELLSQATDDMRIRSGVPDEVTVSSKYGVSYGPVPDASVYSDCGIVYIPQRPFLLCIMTQTNEQEAYKIMKQLAEMTYRYVANTKNE